MGPDQAGCRHGRALCHCKGRALYCNVAAAAAVGGCADRCKVAAAAAGCAFGVVRLHFGHQPDLWLVSRLLLAFGRRPYNATAATGGPVVFYAVKCASIAFVFVYV